MCKRLIAALSFLGCMGLLSATACQLGPVTPTTTPWFLPCPTATLSPSASPTAESREQGTPTVYPTVVDRGLLYGDPCNPPCWEGITPGVSTEEEVVQVLSRLQQEGTVQRYEHYSGRHGPGFSVTLAVCEPAPRGATLGHLDIAVEDGVVRFLYLEYDLARLRYRLVDAIERFGEPATIAGEESPQAECLCPDIAEYYFNSPEDAALVLYPDQGVTFVALMVQPGCLCPGTLISYIYYYEPRPLRDALSGKTTPVCALLPCLAEYMIPWHGYGSGY